ncbi:MAG: hypothetical protein JWN94_2561 [Betaproteobacteria bacterium]|nr:hypothetical protein [Betaproteobacteria bacterium]
MDKIVDGDLPALYRAANEASIETQRTYLRAVFWYGLLTIGGAALSTYGIVSKDLAILAAIILLAAMGVSLLMAFKKFEGTWYRTRAVAESVKTISWHFMMRAAPYSDGLPPADVKAKFRQTLERILSEHKDLGAVLASALAAADQLTQKMQQVRESPLHERVQIYRRDRADDQCRWYAKKAEGNKRAGFWWFFAFVSLQAVAIGCALGRIAYPDYKYWPIQLFVVAAAIIFGWIQVKRFRELSAAYGVTAHEISIAMGELDDVADDEANFARIVSEIERAFSREHTQWVARND